MTSIQAPGTPTAQLKLFQSLSKCIKQIDHSSKILPIRNDVNMYPLSTTDQINALKHIGITNYFKPYKRFQKTIAGDFHVQSKFTYEELKDHQGLNTWLLQHGYNIVKNNCQTADMVKIGFLSRIRGFTLRADFQD